MCGVELGNNDNNPTWEQQLFKRRAPLLPHADAVAVTRSVAARFDPTAVRVLPTSYGSTLHYRWLCLRRRTSDDVNKQSHNNNNDNSSKNRRRSILGAASRRSSASGSGNSADGLPLEFIAPIDEVQGELCTEGAVS